MDFARHRDELFRHDQWRIGIADAPIHRFLEPDFAPAVRWLPPPGRRGYYADPFPLPGDAGPGGLEIGCEFWDARDGRGRLVALDADGAAHPLLGFPGDVHLSYPFFVRDQGEDYCIPESSQAGDVNLYRRQRGREWAFAATLLPEFPGVDATVFRLETRWWMFTTPAGVHSNSALYLFHAPALRGPWTPHRLNPVKSDPSSARPAGTPFVHNNALYRPVQDCSAVYGGALAINRVERLSPDAFAESVAIRLQPPRTWRWRRGWHTLSAAGERTLLDAKRVAFLPAAFGHAFWRKARRGLGSRP
jgi:hypothetical protein